MRKTLLLIIVLTSLVNNNVAAQYWSALGAGIGNFPENGIVYSVAMYNGELYAGGHFSSAGGVAVKGIAKWNGTTWSPVGSGLERDGDPEGPSVYSLTVHNGELYVAGVFNTAGGLPAENIAKWNGTSWSAVGTGLNDFIYSLCVYNGELYAAGLYFSIGSGSPVPCVAKWNGTSWSAVGTGPDFIIDYCIVLTVYNGALYAAGNYGGYGGVPQYYDIAKWDGTSWTALNSQTNGSVNTMTEHDGELYVGGDFTTVGIDSANHIAKWDGTNWSVLEKQINLSWAASQCPVEGTTDGPCNPYYVTSFVRSLAVYNGDLYVAGKFNSSDTVITKNIARWNGINWTALGEGTNAPVQILAISDTSLYVGGSFDTVDGYIQANKIAKWGKFCSISPLQPGKITGNTFVCSGSTQTYFVNPLAGVSKYIWYLPTDWVGNSIDSSITTTVGNQGGDIKVSLVSSGCEFVSRLSFLTIDVNVIPAQPDLILGNIYVNNGNPEIYSVNSVNGATSYVWSLSGGGTIATGQGTNSVNIKWATQGNHVLSVKTSNNCGTSTEQKINIKMSETGGDDLYEIKLSPNPTSGLFYLKAKRVQNKLISVDVMNMMGQSVYHSGPMIGTNDYSQSINLDKMPQGVYMVKINVDDTIYVRRVVKNK